MTPERIAELREKYSNHRYNSTFQEINEALNEIERLKGETECHDTPTCPTTPATEATSPSSSTSSGHANSTSETPRQTTDSKSMTDSPSPSPKMNRDGGELYRRATHDHRIRHQALRDAVEAVAKCYKRETGPSGGTSNMHNAALDKAVAAIERMKEKADDA